jgi:hypothetical protein
VGADKNATVVAGASATVEADMGVAVTGASRMAAAGMIDEGAMGAEGDADGGVAGAECSGIGCGDDVDDGGGAGGDDASYQGGVAASTWLASHPTRC